MDSILPMTRMQGRTCARVRLALLPDGGDELAVFELDAVHREFLEMGK